MKRFLALLAMAVLVPGCYSLGGGNQDSGSGGAGAGIPANPDQVSLDVANADASPYNLSVWEYANGTPLSEVRICWPISGGSLAALSLMSGKASFHADSAVYTHFIVLYNASSGAALESQVFLKGAGQLYLSVTIQFSKMSVLANQF